MFDGIAVRAAGSVKYGAFKPEFILGDKTFQVGLIVEHMGTMIALVDFFRAVGNVVHKVATAVGALGRFQLVADPAHSRPSSFNLRWTADRSGTATVGEYSIVICGGKKFSLVELAPSFVAGLAAG